jgi:ATP-dependent Lhr-like helicase
LSLDLFSPPVREWFIKEFGEPTLPQSKSWPAIQRGENTLTLAPTGSGKTLAAFLWGIDNLYREFSASGNHTKGVRLLYISPLKALNNDIERNLRRPLAGIRKLALDAELKWPELRVAVRSGDTTQRERNQMVTNSAQRSRAGFIVCLSGFPAETPARPSVYSSVRREWPE